ncbi:hypothetical protein [Chondromyces apiculatus]|uniref:hypothetical protein n=1 Tax=Chondromyces apiculatus TaxID=51 RepID=UPI0005C745F9|nr:hypothetical protein [Chondromyces apiculatus]
MSSSRAAPSIWAHGSHASAAPTPRTRPGSSSMASSTCAMALLSSPAKASTAATNTSPASPRTSAALQIDHPPRPAILSPSRWASSRSSSCVSASRS